MLCNVTGNAVSYQAKYSKTSEAASFWEGREQRWPEMLSGIGTERCLLMEGSQGQSWYGAGGIKMWSGLGRNLISNKTKLLWFGMFLKAGGSTSVPAPPEIALEKCLLSVENAHNKPSVSGDVAVRLCHKKGHRQPIYCSDVGLLLVSSHCYF